MVDVSADDIEIRAIKEAYDALKALDFEGRNRSMQWLQSKFADEEQQGRKAREESARRRITSK